ncbi:MAG: hypothetical protein WCK65_09455 [Rhodospirillaceae bacterium]
MPTLREMAYALFGAYRLALMDISGLAYFNRSTAAAARSFFAAVLTFPAYVVLVTLRLSENGTDTTLSNFFVVELIAYVISWTAYALIMNDLTHFLDRSDRYPVFLSAYNWSAVLQMIVYLPLVLLNASGILPDPIGETIVFVTSMAILAYQWYITQVSLDLPAFPAAALVILDLALSVFISGVADGML